MRYNLESTLPINAFSPRGGRGPFSRGMTLEGGGGGFIGKAVSGIAKGVTGVVKGIVDPIYNATLKQIPGVDKALLGLDKAVGKTIPGGWGTVAAIGASFIPGSQLALMGMTKTGLATGLGALSGSGVMKKGHEFNLQGAIMGGAMAYGASQLSQAFQNAGSELAATPTGASTDAVANAAKSGSESALTGTGSAPVSGASTFTPTANALQNIPTDFVPPSSVPTGAPSFSLPEGSDFGLKNIAPNPNITPTPGTFGDYAFSPSVSTPSGLGTSAAPSFLDKVASGAKGTMSNMADAGQGALNLVGLGADGSAAAARSAFTGAASPITQTGVAAGLTGTAGMMALDEQQKALDSQLASGSIGQAEYNTAKAKIDEQVAYANSVVAANPLQTGTDLDSIQANQRDFALARKTDNVNEDFYLAEGGEVDSPNDQLGIANSTPMRNFERGGMYGLAAGGMLPPRFLSGGGDGMSDSIKANINGRQEARLADGEFVIPADVVSHLGNGSSKAGAKQLYSMMDKVRQARVGTKKQGKQINPRKYLAA